MLDKFTEKEWEQFQERVKQASIGERTIGANFFSCNFPISKADISTFLSQLIV